MAIEPLNDEEARKFWEELSRSYHVAHETEATMPALVFGAVFFGIYDDALPAFWRVAQRALAAIDKGQPAHDILATGWGELPEKAGMLLARIPFLRDLVQRSLSENTDDSTQALRQLAELGSNPKKFAKRPDLHAITAALTQEETDFFWEQVIRSYLTVGGTHETNRYTTLATLAATFHTEHTELLQTIANMAQHALTAVREGVPLDNRGQIIGGWFSLGMQAGELVASIPLLARLVQQTITGDNDEYVQALRRLAVLGDAPPRP